MDKREKQRQIAEQMLAGAAIEWGSQFFEIKEDNVKYERGLVLTVYNDKEHKCREWSHCIDLDTIEVEDLPEFSEAVVQKRTLDNIMDAVEDAVYDIREDYDIPQPDKETRLPADVQRSAEQLASSVARSLVKEKEIDDSRKSL